jgi:hypothetical protein
MHPSQHPATAQQQRIGRYVNNADSYPIFNMPARNRSVFNELWLRRCCYGTTSFSGRAAGR